MSDTAAASVNPNVSVGAESQVTSRANSAISFDQIDAADAPAPKEEKREKKPEAKKEAPPTKEKTKVEDADDEKPAKAAKPEKPEKEEKPEAKAEPKPEPKQKPKVHKFKVGDETRELPGDAMIEVPVDGKNEQVSLEDLRSSYSGKQYYTRKLGELGKREDEHKKQVSSLQDWTTKLGTKAKEDPDTAWDFLAEITNQNPIELKSNMFREQVKLARQLAHLSDEQVEELLRTKTIDWRDKIVSRKESDQKQQKENEAKETELRGMKEKFLVSDEDYSTAEKMVSDYLKASGEEREPTPQEIIYGTRHIMALQTVREVVPELENNPRIRDILRDVAEELVRNPSMTRETLGKTLKATFGQDESDGRKRLGQKVRERTETDDGPITPRSPKKEAISFDDL